MLAGTRDRWECRIKTKGVTVDVTVRIGMELWVYLAGHDSAFLELACAIIRACVAPSDARLEDHRFTISDLAQILSADSVPDGFNVSVLQRSQLEWLFFFSRHFCDGLEDA